MKIKHQDIEIPEDSPFLNCKLKRQPYAEILTTIVDTYADGFVLAINNKWGTGKTTFVKMWQQQLKNENFKTLYFNAWENDFDKIPLVAIMSELKTLLGEKNKEAFKSVLKKAAVLNTKVIPAILKGILTKYMDLKEFNEVVEKLTEGSAELLEEEVTEYAEKKKGLLTFRKELEEFIKKTNPNNNKPLIFIIDELDRCRPSYAVEVLENVKHFFNVPGIVFVLSIDKIQLGNAVRGFYGSDKIDAEEYLRRFIDIEYGIPNPDTSSFCNYLFSYFNLNSFFISNERIRHNEFINEGNDFKKFASLLFEKKGISLRQQEKIFGHTALVLRLVPSNSYLLPELFLVLVYLKTLHHDLYTDIESRNLSLQDLLDKFQTTMPIIKDDEEKRPFIYTEAILAYLYSLYLNPRNSLNAIFRRNTNEEQSLKINSRMDDSTNSQTFIDNIIYFEKKWNFVGVGINFLLEKISLLNKISP